MSGTQRMSCALQSWVKRNLQPNKSKVAELTLRDGERLHESEIFDTWHQTFSHSKDTDNCKTQAEQRERLRRPTQPLGPFLVTLEQPLALI